MAAALRPRGGQRARRDCRRGAGPRQRSSPATSSRCSLRRPAIAALLDALPKVDDAVRRELRAALARAAKNPRAFPALEEELAPAKLAARPEIARVDLLRAIGPSLGQVRGAGEAFASLAASASPTSPSTAGAEFRTRYLLQAPAAELARAGDARATAFLRDSLRKDPDAHVRRRAAEVAAKVAARLLSSAPIRWPRSTTATPACARPRLSRSAQRARREALRRRASRPRWAVASPPTSGPLVRSGAARALAAMPASPSIDKLLVDALADASADVRGHALDALGAHRATAFIDEIRERSTSAEELAVVRARAVLALAAMCDRKGADYWTKLALRTKAPFGEDDRTLGGASIAALGMVHPPDSSRCASRRCSRRTRRSRCVRWPCAAIAAEGEWSALTGLRLVSASASRSGRRDGRSPIETRLGLPARSAPRSGAKSRTDFWRVALVTGFHPREPSWPSPAFGARAGM